jgi:hypothetical protein
VESSSVLEAKKKLLRENSDREQQVEERELYERLRERFKSESREVSSDDKELNDAYDEEVLPIREKHEQRLLAEITRLTDDYTARRDWQDNLANTITRLSPIGIVNNLMAEFSGTGYSEANNFLQHAKQFQETVKREIYDKFIIRTYRSKTSSMSTSEQVPDFDPSSVPVPVLENYKYLGVGAILRQNRLDIALLCVYGFLFFALAFVSFLRFDVR